MTTTTERIANAIKPIIEEDRRADRERIAELERDLAHARTAQHAAVTERDRLQAFVDSLNAKLDEAHKENARLVMERDFYKGAAPSAMQAAAPGQTSTATGGVVDCSFPACGPRCKKDCPPLPVVEEQGPWVVYAADNKIWKYGSVGSQAPICWYPAEGLIGSSSAQWFATKQDAEAASAQSAEKGRVITLAEARAIEAKRG